jgi:hypothetical protein
MNIEIQNYNNVNEGTWGPLVTVLVELDAALKKEAQ